jgi:hypothetical protein
MILGMRGFTMVGSWGLTVRLRVAAALLIAVVAVMRIAAAVSVVAIVLSFMIGLAIWFNTLRCLLEWAGV